MILRVQFLFPGKGKNCFRDHMRHCFEGRLARTFLMMLGCTETMIETQTEGP